MLPRKYIVPFSQRLILANDIHCPARSRVRGNQPVLWTGKIPIDFLDEQLLVRNVGLSSQGKLDDTTVNLAASLKIPHHVGA